jgi:hypothetical protein
MVVTEASDTRVTFTTSDDILLTSGISWARRRPQSRGTNRLVAGQPGRDEFCHDTLAVLERCAEVSVDFRLGRCRQKRA